VEFSDEFKKALVKESDRLNAPTDPGFLFCVMRGNDEQTVSYIHGKMTLSDFVDTMAEAVARTIKLMKKTVRR